MITFLTEQRIKDFTPVLGNVDAKLIEPLIRPLAKMWVEPLLGSYFFNHLLGAYNTQTLTATEEILVSYIQETLIWRAAADIVITTSAQITNKGLQTQNGLNSNPLGLGDVSFISKHYTQKAEFFNKRLENFIRLNISDFPQFSASQNNDSTIVDMTPVKGGSYNNDIIFI